MPTVTSATELEALEITGAAGVRRGANRAQFGADGWALMKADGTPLGGRMPTATLSPEDIAKALEALPEPIRAALQKQADDLTAATEAQTTAETRVAELEAAATAGEGGEAPVDLEKALESLPAPVRDQLRKQTEDLAAAQKAADDASSVAKAERDARVEREYIGKAETFAALPGKAATFGPVLRSVAEQCDPLVALELDRVLRAYDEQVRTGELFKSAGHDGTGDTSAYAQLEAHATELRKSDTKLTKEQAIALASEQRPDLVAQHRTEQKGR